MVLNNDLVEYIEKKIFPIYDTFDKGHDVSHIMAVIERAIELYKYIGDPLIDVNIVYASAALHDIGVSVERKNHSLHSQKYVLGCAELKRFFTDEEIVIIGEAVADHSTSRGVEPRSIYGKIVCDADKDNDIDISLLRAYEYTKSYYPDYTEEECLNNVYNQLVFKFGDEGKVKFWINSEQQNEFKQVMHDLAVNKELFLARMTQITKSKNVSKK